MAKAKKEKEKPVKGVLVGGKCSACGKQVKEDEAGHSRCACKK